MILPWLFLMIEILLFYIIKPLTSNPEFFATLIIAFNIPIVLFIFIRYTKEAFLLLFIGFFLRLALMYWDIYAFDIFLLPHSGEDSIGFYESALQISQDTSLLNSDIYGGLYSKILGIVLFFGPTSRILLQYINVLLGMFTIILVYNMMTQLKIQLKTKKVMLLIMILFPTSLILSSILLREALITFLITLSFSFFLQWIFKGNIKYVILATSLVVIGALFHSGVISVLVGYIFMLLFYRPATQKFQASRNTVIVFSALLMSMFYLTSVGAENIPFLSKYTHALETTDNLYELTTGGRGGSLYLQGLEINNPTQLILYSPLKMFYFITSPLPFDWRGIIDLFTFMSDGLIYGVLIIYPVLNYRKMIKGDPVTISLFIALIIVIFTFGIALNNAGTALRHRNKLFYLIILLFSLGIAKRKNKNQKLKQSVVMTNLK